MTITLNHCIALDEEDPLSGFKDRFVMNEDTVYLDGNSLGALPTATINEIDTAVSKEWGSDLIRSWNSAGWFEMPVILGNQLEILSARSPGKPLYATALLLICLRPFTQCSESIPADQKSSPIRMTFPPTFI